MSFFVYCVIKRIIDHVPTLVVKQEWNNCIVSSIHLSVRFDWRNVALALAARISIAEYPLQPAVGFKFFVSRFYYKSRLVVQNLKMAWSRRFIQKLFVWHSSRDIVRMKWRYYRAGLYTEKKRSHWLRQWPIRKGLGDKKRGSCHWLKM